MVDFGGKERKTVLAHQIRVSAFFYPFQIIFSCTADMDI